MSEQILEELVWEEPLSPKEIIEDELIKRCKKDRFIVLYSGGSDSGSVDNFIAENYPENYEGRLFTNTGISSPMTRKFALDYSNELGRKIEMTWARKSFYDITMNVGFRSMGAHRIIMAYLKAHSWHYYIQPLKKIGNYCFISGVRKTESMTRNKIKFYSQTPIDVNAGDTFCKPFLYKNGTQLQEYRIKNGIKRSPAYEFFNKSGDCWCGTQSHPWELKMLEAHDPFVFNTIKWLESEIQRVGSPTARKHPYWGNHMGAEVAEQQLTLDEFDVLTKDEDSEITNLLKSNVVVNCGESCEVA